jgi:SNF2 family DNA or RNA helicase
MSATSALRLGLGLQNSNSLLPVVGISSSGWIQQLLDSQRKSLELVHPPDSFQGTLREYQRVGVSWLHFLSQLGIGGCLADDMGLGKTIQFLALLLYEQEKDKTEGVPLRPTLLVVPMSILDNWEREAKRFAPA